MLIGHLSISNDVKSSWTLDNLAICDTSEKLSYEYFTLSLLEKVVVLLPDVGDPLQEHADPPVGLVHPPREAAAHDAQRHDEGDDAELGGSSVEKVLAFVLA